MLVGFLHTEETETRVLLFLLSIIWADIFLDDLKIVSLNLSVLIFLSFFLILLALFIWSLLYEIVFLNLQIGFSHDVSYKIPDEIKVLVEKSTKIKISGTDKQRVGKVASEIKMLKPVEPYKGKGIKERNQYVLRKEGKKK